jgi:predicted enzyme related to lactoylglutathione lyase
MVTGPHSLMVVLYVRDMYRALAFWRDGLGLAVMTHSPGWSRLSCGDASVGLHLIERRVSEQPVPYAGPNFEVDDLEEAVERAMAAGAQMVELREAEPRVPMRLAVLTDPEGNGFELRKTVA